MGSTQELARRASERGTVTEIVVTAYRRPSPSRSRFTDRLAEFFRRQPDRWVDARDLMSVGGVCAWRSRLSDLRRAPFNMRVDNRVRVLSRPDGGRVKVSEYCYRPSSTEAGARGAAVSAKS